MARIFLGWLCLIIAGCTSLPPSTTQPWLWQLSGRAVFQDNQQRDSASIYWQSAPEQDIIQLSGPFGQGAVRLISDFSGASLWQDGEQRIQAPNLETLLFEQLNWRVPVQEFRAWVRGETAEGTYTLINSDANGRQFEQAGWRIAQSKLQANGLPQKVVIERAPYKLTLLIAQWKP